MYHYNKEQLSNVGGNKYQKGMRISYGLRYETENDKSNLSPFFYGLSCRVDWQSACRTSWYARNHWTSEFGTLRTILLFFMICIINIYKIVLATNSMYVLCFKNALGV